MPSIRDFSGGVVNQVLQNQDTGAGVLFDCKNVLSSWNGELRKRTGTSYVKKLDSKTRVIPFHNDNTQDDLVCLFSPNILKIYRNINGSLELYSNTTYQRIEETWTSNTSPSGIIVDSDFYNPVLPTTNTYKIFNNNLDYTTVRPMLKPDANYYGWVVSADSASIPYGKENAIFNFTFPTPNSIQKLIFCFANIYSWNTQTDKRDIGAALLEPVIQYSDNGSDWVSVKTVSGDLSDSGGAYSEFKFPGTGVNYQTWSYNDRIMKISNSSETNKHVYWRVVFTNLSQLLDVYKGQSWKWCVGCNLYTQDSAGEQAVFETDYSEEDLDNIKFAQSVDIGLGASNSMYIACKGKTPKRLSFDGGVFDLNNFVPAKPATSIWNTLGTPSCVIFYQNRLWFAGFALRPTCVIGSAFSDFNDFDWTPSTVIATSPILVESVEIKYLIENMWAGNNALYCLSEDGVSMIDAQGGIVATDQIEFKLRNREPASGMLPTVKDDIMIYLGRDKRKILITDYDFVVQRYKAINISTKYDDFLSKKISSLYYIPKRSGLIYGILENGKWFALLFDSDKGINSVYPFETNGNVINIQPIKYQDSTMLFMVVARNGNYFLESKNAQQDVEFMDFMTKEEKEIYTNEVIHSSNGYLDSMQNIHFVNPTSLITDLPYQEGDDVCVIADGIYLGNKRIIHDEQTNSNAIQLDFEVNDIVLGYTYDSYAVIKFVSPYNLRKFPKEISANFINTGYLEMGNTFDSLEAYLQNMRESVILNNKPILYNGNYTKTFDKQAFETPYIIIRSNVGLPFIITGLDYKVDMSNYQGGV